MSAKSIIKSRKGYSVLLVILGIIVAGIAMLPITKWYLSLHAGMEDLDTRFEMQSIVQDAWNRLLAEDYDETNERIKTNGNTFTEDIGSKWTLQYTYGSEGKYSAAQCTSATPDDDDQKCRKVTISLTAKDGSVKPYSIDTTRVSSAGSGSIKTGIGWIEFPGRIVMQYGYAQGPAGNSTARVTFPKAFSQLFSVNVQRVPHPYSAGYLDAIWSNSDSSNEVIFNVNNSGFSFYGSYYGYNGGILYTAWGKI